MTFLSSINEKDEYLNSFSDFKNNENESYSHSSSFLKNTSDNHQKFFQNDFIEKDSSKEKTLNQERKIQKSNFEELIEENKRLNDNIKEISLFCEDLKKERDVIFEDYQQKILENEALQLLLKNANLNKSNNENLNSETNENNKFLDFSTNAMNIFENKQIKLSKWMALNEQKLIEFETEEDENTISSDDADESHIYFHQIHLYKFS